MIKARRIGHAAFETPDLDRQIEYYEQVVGLQLSARERGRAFMATESGQVALQLDQASAPKCTKLTFEVTQDDDFEKISKRLAADGIQSEVRTDPSPGVPKTLSFKDINGTDIDLFSEWKFLDTKGPVTGVNPMKFGHLAMEVPDPKRVAEFYCKVLGFRISDWIEDYFVFLRCNTDHHTCNFVKGSYTRLNHVAYELKDAAHMQAACEWLGRNKIDIIWGPGRHGAGSNIFTYHRNPDDQVVEFYTELDQMLDEDLGYWDPKPWHADKPLRPKVWDRKSAGLVWGPPPTPDFTRGRDAPAAV